MGQVLQLDKIGNLSESGGTITLAPSVLTIGGQQFRTQALSVTPSGTIAETWYRVYSVLNSGVPQLVVSTNNNSQGPAGYNAWKLVGVFYTGASNGIFGLSKARVNGQVDQSTLIAKASLSSNQSVASANTYTVVEFDTLNADSRDLGSFESGSNLFRAPTRGWYKISTGVSATNLSTSDVLRVAVSVNGGAAKDPAASSTETYNFTAVHATFYEYLNQNETVAIQAASSVDSSWTITSANSFVTFKKIPDSTILNDEDL